MLDKKLSTGEILAIMGILALGGEATTEDLVNLLGTSEQFIRNIMVKLRKRNIVSSLGSADIKAGIIFGAPVPEVSLKPRQKIHVLNMGLDDIFKKYPEILAWLKVTLGVNTIEEFKRYLEKLKEKNVKRKAH